MTNKITQKARRETFKDPYETEGNIVSQIKDSARAEFSQDWKIAMQQMLGVNEANTEKKASGDLNEGEELIFSRKEQKPTIQPAIDYAGEILHSQEKTSRKENQELRIRLDEITIELKKLSRSSKQLEVTFKDVNVEMLPQTPGKYHVNFFEWLLITIQNARMRIEESASWVGVVSGKKAKKDYWSLSKKHGTSYMLSGERVTATQTG